LHKAKGKDKRSPPLDDTSFLHALQVADSFFPTGMVTLSHALETYVDEETIHTKEDFEELLEDYLCHQIGGTDSIALANAHRAAVQGDLQAIVRIDWMLSAMKLVKESRDSSVKSGRRMLAVCDRLTSDSMILQLKQEVEQERSQGNYVVVLGVLSSALGIPCKQAILIELYSFAVSFLGAAVRLGRLNYLQVQDILQSITATIVKVADENMGKTIQEMRAFAPSIDIMGMKHQRAEKRLFIS